MVKGLLKGNLVKEPKAVQGGYVITLACNLSRDVTFFANVYGTENQISEKMLEFLTKGRNILVDVTMRNNKDDSSKTNFFLERLYF